MKDIDCDHMINIDSLDIEQDCVTGWCENCGANFQAMIEWQPLEEDQ